MQGRVIDTHAHVIAPDTKRYPLTPLGGHQSDWSRERPVSFERMIADMDEAGIARAALVQASTCYGYDNSYLADAVAARSFPAWECVSEAGIPVCVQLRAAGLPQLVTVLERFPKVRIVLDHMARPMLDDGPPYGAASSLFSLRLYPKLFLKLTTHNVRESSRGRATPGSFFGRLVEKFGASRIAWGSNYPASEGTLAGVLAEAREALAFLSSEDQDWIFFRTALSLYPVLAEKAAGSVNRGHDRPVSRRAARAPRGTTAKRRRSGRG